MYPLKFESLQQERVWGSESWELSCHPHGLSVVKNGVYAGMILDELIKRFPNEILGRQIAAKTCSFPLLIKTIYAQDRLSIQVHPDDDYALRLEGQSGKTEAWYVIDADEGAQIVYGLQPGLDREAFLEIVKAGKTTDAVRFVAVRPGDLVHVPAGTVHALTKGIVVYEVQQTSDVTYRIFDYNRCGSDGLPRQLHLEKAADVIDFDSRLDAAFNTDELRCPYFSIQRLDVEQEKTLCLQGTFLILYAVSGSGALIYQQGRELLEQGETVLIPASLGDVRINGNVSVLVVASSQ